MGTLNIQYVAAETRPKIVCFGDSITKRTYPDTLASLVSADVVKAAVAGHSSGQSMSRLGPQVLEQKPDVVVILLGTNDIRVAEGQVLKRYKR